MVMTDRPYLSIGEVLGLLLEEFPDVTISKIRFLESQGLIDPERTASGYRKFYDSDVDLLRVILREQRETFLPWRVIRDRLESGAIEDPTGPTTPPRGIRNGNDADNDNGRELPTHPSAIEPSTAPLSDAEPPGEPAPLSTGAAHRVEAAPAEHRREAVPARELCHLSRLTSEQLEELESFGLLSGKGSGAATMYTAADVAIAEAASGFMQHGVGGRHLRAWRQAAEREAALFESMI